MHQRAGTSSNDSLTTCIISHWRNNIILLLVLDETDETVDADIETVPLASPFHVTRKMAEGLEGCTWPGRTQVLHRGQTTFFLDGAHTEDSIAYCIRWFLTASAALQP